MRNRISACFLPFAGVVLLVACLGSLFFSCSKSSFLEKPPSTQLVLPSSLGALRALLDNDKVMNLTPMLGELSADNFYLQYSFWVPLSNEEKYGYIWDSDVYRGQTNIMDWNLPYQQVFYANTVLDALGKIDVSDDSLQESRSIRGSALFARAYAFHQLAQIFCADYDTRTASADLGIPLRLSPAIDSRSVRASVQETYDRILADLDEARALLPSQVPYDYPNRSSVAAVQALRARVYLAMGDYANAGLYADSCLQIHPALIDYNTVDTGSLQPFKRLNDEAIYQSRLPGSITALLQFAYPQSIVDSILYRSYDSNDLRRSAYYVIDLDGYPNAKGNYSGTVIPFTGLATDEVLLIRAEAYAWAGNAGMAVSDLNQLMEKRWASGHFTPFVAESAGQALALIRTERRKELAFRGLRWPDLRRLNKEGAGIGLTRMLNGQTYVLPPGDKRYILPIPPDVIVNSGMQQNPR